ncbi:MFS general substrate transporter [Rhizodiscina lignyota]|uniref:MFS general substrate transporter n=1 Tax=Rhizodiscina lignyota TaxID=1504668 RepID=A0A9P4IMY8_9PEZI|nr:MFS general substrate transporter [Rhizodiscina lignyota]
MGWGILEDRRTPRPSGTVPLGSKESTQDVESAELQHLKRKGQTILQPQPSDSINDPLNWSYTRKGTIFLIMLVAAIAIVGINQMLNTGLQILAVQFGTDFATIVRDLSPPTIAAQVIGLFVASATAAVWGKRVQFVIASIVIFFTMLAGYFANSLPYYQVVLIFSGFASAPVELLIAPVVSDMTFVHERGTLFALASMVGVIGTDASHIISGNIISRLGVNYTFIISFAVWAPIMVLIYFFVFETTYTRPASKAIKDNQSQSSGSTSDLEKERSRSKTTWEQLRIFQGRLTDRSFFLALVQPFPLVLFPSVVFCTIVYGAFSTWVTILGTVSLEVLAYPPYSLPPDQLAYITLPGSGVGFISSVVAGLLSDWLIKFMARRNGGIYEPEFRLLLMIPAVILSTVGFWLLGPAFAAGSSVVKLVGLSLLVSAGSPFAATASYNYIFDTQQRSSTEAFVTTSLFRAVFNFFGQMFVPTWFVRAGPVKVFTTLAILNLAISALTIPMYVFGKRIRGAVSRNAWLMKISGGD